MLPPERSASPAVRAAIRRPTRSSAPRSGRPPLASRRRVRGAEPAAVERHVLQHRQPGHHRVVDRVLGDADGAGLRSRRDAGRRRGAAATRTVPAGGRPQAERDLAQLALAAARDAGDADELARVHLEVDARAARRAPRSPRARDAHRSSSTGGSRSGTAARSAAQRRHPPPDHRLDQLGVGEVGRVAPASTTRPPRSTVTRSAMARTSPSLWVTITTPRPLLAQLATTREQRLDLLRREHAGRLVEDDEPGAGHQHLQDLDALALADRQVPDQCAGVDRQPVARRWPPRCVGREPAQLERRTGRGSASAMFSATVSAGTRRRSWNTMPMPSARASAGCRRRPVSPSTSSVPSSGW